MELSSIELEYICNELHNKIIQGYYVSSITNITKSSFLIKLHHITYRDILLMISSKAIWITNFNFKNIEENEFSKVLVREIERMRIEKIEHVDGERIIKVKFSRNEENKFLICEFFGNGNLILCNNDMKIIGTLHELEVRHRKIKVGVVYELPPKKGVEIEKINFEKFEELFFNEKHDTLVSKWIGRTYALPKKFSEEIVTRANVKGMSMENVSAEKLNELYSIINFLLHSIKTRELHNPIIIIDENVEYQDISPIRLESVGETSLLFRETFLEAIDEVFSKEIINIEKKIKASDIEKQIAILEHDVNQQEKAKRSVIDKSKSIRELAGFLMNQYAAGKKEFDNEIVNQISNFSAKVVEEKGKKYFNIYDEKIEFANNLPKLSSILYSYAKGLESGNIAIDEAKQKLIDKINQLKNKSLSIQKKVIVNEQTIKEWYERYRWFITTDKILAIGGRDASSNSAIIRKHLSEKDIVFHAEIHGSPFFILKDVGDNIENCQESIMQVAQATVSFSRAWKDGLSSGDCFWVLPEQVKKGAPTGQFLAKGSFVIEGKRNYIKALELKLSFGITQINNQNKLICGPTEAIKRITNIYISLLPLGLDPLNVAKKIKSELISLAERQNRTDIADFIKKTSTEDIIRSCPQGKSKIVSLKTEHSRLS